MRVNFRRNLVAVDSHPNTDLTALLQVATICATKVRAKQLDLNTCVGMVFGVDPTIPFEDLADNLASPVPIRVRCTQRQLPHPHLRWDYRPTGYPAL